MNINTNTDSDIDRTYLSFDEFSLYYASTEKVTDRRIETNRWNYSICVATLIACALIANWTVEKPTSAWMGYTAIGVLSSIALLFCMLWVGQIRDFKRLNDAKFKVLNEMAPRLGFEPVGQTQVLSFRPLEREWDKLLAASAAKPVKGLNLVALSSSSLEVFMPVAFGVLFAVVLTLVATLTLFRPQAPGSPTPPLKSEPVKQPPTRTP